MYAYIYIILEIVNRDFRGRDWDMGIGEKLF